MKYLLATVWAFIVLIMIFDVLAENTSNNNNNVQRLMKKKKIYHGATPANSYNTMHNNRNQKQLYQTQKLYEQLTTMPYSTLNTEQYGFNSALNYRQQQQQQQYSMQQQQPIQEMQQQFRKRDLTPNKTGLCPDPKTSEYDFVCGLFQCDSDQSCMGVEKCCSTSCGGRICMKPAEKQN